MSLIRTLFAVVFALNITIALQASSLTVSQLSATTTASANQYSTPNCLQSMVTGTVTSYAPVSVSLNCILDQSAFMASSSASRMGASGVGNIASTSIFNRVPDYGDEVNVSGSFSETLTFNGGSGIGFVAIPIAATFDDASDYATATATLGSQTVTDCGGLYGGCYTSSFSYSQFTPDFLVSQFTYGVPFTFSFQAASVGDEGGNSNDEAGYTFSIEGQPILLSALPSGVFLGNNRLPNALHALLTPVAGLNDFVDTTAPEPGTMILCSGMLLLVALRIASRCSRQHALPAVGL